MKGLSLIVVKGPQPTRAYYNVQTFRTRELTVSEIRQAGKSLYSSYYCYS